MKEKFKNKVKINLILQSVIFALLLVIFISLIIFA